jgi:hypothetical protein
MGRTDLTARPFSRTLPSDKMSDGARPRRREVEAPARRPRPKVQVIRVVIEDDPNPDTAYLGQAELAERRAAYARDEFSFLAVRAEAEVVIEGIAQTLTSAGAPGIESDIGEEYVAQVAQEEWSALRDVLKTVGVPTNQLPLAVAREWVEWRS